MFMAVTMAMLARRVMDMKMMEMRVTTMPQMDRRRTAVAHAVEGRQRLLPEALAACCWPSPPKEPRCSSQELHRAHDLRQRYLLIGTQRDVVGERLGGASEVICERKERGRRGLAVFLGGVGVGHRKRLWARFWLKWGRGC